MFTSQQKLHSYKEIGKCGPFTGENNKNLTEIIFREAHTELLVKDVKPTVLYMFNELKETMDWN